MLAKNLRLTDGAAAGAWINPRLGGEFGAVTLQVPKGYEAYARVFHPASDPKGNDVRWEDVAAVCGTTAHQEMQWHAILGLADADDLHGSHAPDEPNGSRWQGSDPPTGAMDLDTLDALCGVLAAEIDDRGHCFFGLCTIMCWDDQFSAKELRRNRLLKLPGGRHHIVLAGPLSAVDEIVKDRSKPSPRRVIFASSTAEGPPPEIDPSWLLWREAPNLIWPADHSWLVASEVDFDSTLVGGSAALIEAIVSSPDLEAWQVEPTTSLADDADKINVLPESSD